MSSRTVQEARCRGHRGGIITPHRAILALRFDGRRLALSLSCALAFGLAWALLLNPLARLWSELLDQLCAWMSLPASTALREVTLLDGGVRLLLPRLELSASEPSSGQWWWGLALTAVALALSFILPRRHLPVLYWLRLMAAVQASALIVFRLFPGAFPYDLPGYTEVLLTAGLFLLGLVPWIYGLTYSVLALPLWRTMLLDLLAMTHLAVFVPLQILAHAWLVHHASLLWMPLVFWMYGLALDVGVLIALYSWAVSWNPAHRQPERLRGSALVGLGSLALVAALALDAAPVQAEAPRHGLEIGTSVGSYTEGLGDLDGQTLSLWHARPGVDRWRLDLGRAARFDDEGVGVALGYAHQRGRTEFRGGVSTGTGDVLFPRWRVDLGARAIGLLDERLVVDTGFTHVQSKAENYADGVGVALRWALGGPWSASLEGRADLGRPGNTLSHQVGAGIQFSLYRRLYLDAAIRAGEVAYVLLTPDEARADFSTRGLEVGGALYVESRTGLSLRLLRSDTDVYDLWSLSLGLFREW